MTPNTIEFRSTSDNTWVMRITADRKIEVNEDVDVTFAAQKVLDAMQYLLTNKSAQPESWEKFCDSNCVWTDHHPDCRLAQTQEPVAWIHNFIEGGISIGKRPADLERHPNRWTALYKEPKPCPTCEALARTVMLDQTSHDTTPPQRTEQNFCSRCGKRTADLTHIHTCTPPHD